MFLVPGGRSGCYYQKKVSREPRTLSSNFRITKTAFASFDILLGPSGTKPKMNYRR